MSKWANNNFGGNVVSGQTKHVVAYKIEGSWIGEMQVQEQKPYGTEFVVYDDSFNEIDSFNFRYQRSEADGWRITPFPNIEDMLISKDRWLIVSTGTSTTRYLNGYTHLGRSYIFIDLDDLENLKYDSINEVGETHTYTTASFVVHSHIPRQRSFPFQVTTLGGKEKIVSSAWESQPDLIGRTGVMSEDPWVPALYVHDIDEMIAAGESSPRTVTLDSIPQKILPFEGNGTPVQVGQGSTSQGAYNVYVSQGLDIGDAPIDQIKSTLPNLSVGADKIMVSDVSKSHLYEYTNGSLSETPIVIPKKFYNGVINGPQYHIGEKVYYDIVNFPDGRLTYDADGNFNGNTENFFVGYNVSLVEPFQLTEPFNYPRAYWPDPLSTNIESGGRRLKSAYETGNLSPWITQLPRRTVVSIDYNNDGSYQVTGGGPFGGELLGAGRWLAIGDTANNGGFEDPTTELISVNGVEITLGDRTSYSVHTGQSIYENKDFAPNLKIAVGDSGVTIQEMDLSIDPSTPIEVELKFRTGISGISSISSSQHEITANVILSGVALPNVELDHPSAIINVAPSVLLEWPDDAFTHIALDIWKPHVPYENDANGYLPETLTLDANTESVEFLIRGSAMNGQQMTFEFGNGWVDSYGDSLGTVTIDLHPSDLSDPNPRGDAFDSITLNARLGSLTGGEDLSVTVSTLFENWRQSEYDNNGITTTMTRIIPIQINAPTS